MKFKRWIGAIFGVIIVSINISCDQLTKSIVRNKIAPSEQIIVIDDHLTLTNVENTGAFLSLGQKWWQPAKVIVLMVLPVMTLMAGIYFMMKLANRHLWLILAMGFAIGGGIGNMIDRLLYGSVTDFLHIKAGPFQTGIFNMADVSIMIGIGMLLLFSLKRRKQAYLR